MFVCVRFMDSNLIFKFLENRNENIRIYRELLLLENRSITLVGFGGSPLTYSKKTSVQRFTANTPISIQVTYPALRHLVDLITLFIVYYPKSVNFYIDPHIDFLSSFNELGDGNVFSVNCS